MANGSVHRRRRSVDRLSDLPDELLHSILIHLPSTFEAARTSVLSRRWRRVWTNAPALSFSVGEQQASYASILDGIDAAMDAHAAPALVRLAISAVSHGYPVARVPLWLRRFASRRLAGELRLKFTRAFHAGWQPTVELEVPVCERATSIDLQLTAQQHLRFPGAGGGTFTALRVLSFECHKLHLGDLERALSTQCPRLQELALSVTNLDGALSIRSGSVERLVLRGGGTGQISVDAPRLARLELSRAFSSGREDEVYSAHIVAARELQEVIWDDAYFQGDRIVTTQRRLRRLKVDMNCSSVFPRM